MSTPPHWDLTNVYPSLTSKEFKAAVADYKRQVASLEKFFEKQLSTGVAGMPSSSVYSRPVIFHTSSCSSEICLPVFASISMICSTVSVTPL